MDNGELSAIDAATGETRWSYRTSGQVFGIRGVRTTRQLIVWCFSTTNLSGTSGNLVSSYTVLSLDKGTVQWSKNLVDLYAPPTGSVFYALDDRMNLLAVQATTGDLIWSRPTTLTPQIAVILNYTGSLRMEQEMLFCYPGTAAAQSAGGLLAAFETARGRTLWTLKTTANDNGYAASDQILCYLDKTLKAVDIRAGAAQWTAGAGLGPLQFIGKAKALFLAAALGDRQGHGGLYGWDTKTGRLVWHHPVSGGSGKWSGLPIPGGMFASHAGNLFFFSLPAVQST